MGRASSCDLARRAARRAHPRDVLGQHGLRDEPTTRKWDPGLNDLGRFAESRPEGTRFVAASWGVATQIFCFSQGRPEFIHEAYWSYDGKDELAAMLAAFPAKNTVYLVALDPAPQPHADAADRIFADAASLVGWREEPVEPELRAITCVRAKKLVRDQLRPR